MEIETINTKIRKKLGRQEDISPLHPDNDGGTVGDKPREEVIEQIIIIIIHAFIFAHKIKEGQIMKSGDLRIRGAVMCID